VPDEPDFHTLRRVVCSTPDLCFAHDESGVARSASPSAIGTPWTRTEIDRYGSLEDLSCTPGICAAVDNQGSVVVGLGVS
jgi:hypothetical protein